MAGGLWSACEIARLRAVGPAWSLLLVACAWRHVYERCPCLLFLSLLVAAAGGLVLLLVRVALLAQCASLATLVVAARVIAVASLFSLLASRGSA